MVASIRISRAKWAVNAICGRQGGYPPVQNVARWMQTCILAQIGENMTQATNLAWYPTRNIYSKWICMGRAFSACGHVCLVGNTCTCAVVRRSGTMMDRGFRG